jgi:hypothetical protein
MSITCTNCGMASEGKFDVDWCQNCKEPILGFKSPKPQNLLDGIWSLESSGGNFSGSVIDGLAEGYGTLFHDQDCMLVGNFTSGKINGKGTVITLNEIGYGNTFVGEIKNGVYSGYGKYVFGYPCFYEGIFKDYKYHGEGIRVFNDNTEYRGEFINGHPHGYGVERYSDRSEYCGSFEFGKKSGKGIETFLLGAKYEGNYFEGRFEGIGKYIFPDGETWDGWFSTEWLDVRGGKAIFYTVKENNGKKRFGKFQNDGSFKDYTSVFTKISNSFK